MDKMIAYMNKHYSDKYIFKYSTPSDYVQSINKLNHTWPTKTTDMFPYGDGPDYWWTGYFSSRGNAKSFVRKGSHHFHASSQLYSVRMLDQDLSQHEE
jgi:hypothetical protein